MARRGSLRNLADRLLEANQRGEVRILFAPSIINRPGMPTHSGIDNALVFWGPLLGAVAAWFVDGWIAALVVAAFGVVGFVTVGRAWVLNRCKRRAFQLIEADEDALLSLWQAGGFMLVHVPSNREFLPMDGDFRDFVREHLLSGRSSEIDNGQAPQ